jgi:hypothetical protein
MTKKPIGWYKELVIRPVLPVDGYESYEKICEHVANIYFNTDQENLKKGLLTSITDSRYISKYTLFKVGEAKCPVYWVSADLLTALMQSDLTIEADNLHWAMKTGIFMLPKGLVFSPDNNSIQAIFWHYETTKDYLYWTAIDKDNCFCRRFLASNNSRTFKYNDVQDFDPQVVIDFNEYLQGIFLRLLLIMECRPELVEQESKLVTVNKGFAKNLAKDFYEPLWIGRNYRVKRQDAQDVTEQQGTNTSKSIHWRRGFLRNQPYGKGREQRKLIWIEPVLVMGGKS